MSETVEMSIDHINEMHEMIGHQQETIDIDRKIKESLEAVVATQEKVIAACDEQIEMYKETIKKLNENCDIAFRAAQRYEEILEGLGLTG